MLMMLKVITSTICPNLPALEHKRLNLFIYMDRRYRTVILTLLERS